MSLDLPTPDEFIAFPYKPPYDIQTTLMQHVYSAIERKKIAIVESPTGTGKTLTLLCSSLTWLNDEKNRAKLGQLNNLVGDVSNMKGWVVEQTKQRLIREFEADEQAFEDRLKEAREREAAFRRATRGKATKRARMDVISQVQSVTQPVSKDSDISFLPDDEEPDDGTDEPELSQALRELMAQVDGPKKVKSSQSEEEIVCTKVYYASRTHSQLSQVLPELGKLMVISNFHSYHPNFGEPMSLKRKSEDAQLENEDSLVSKLCSRTVPLGSRKQLCINDKLRSRSNDIDEACRELLSEKGDKRCEFLPPKQEDYKMLDFRDQILAAPKDIEDLAAIGRFSGICPYFGARRAIPQAELVTLPYNLLLQKSAREALGIDLKNQIVIVDEAHNLISTLLSLSSCQLFLNTLVTAFSQVCQYVSRFRNRLAPRHMVQLKRLIVFLDALTKFLNGWVQEQRDANDVKSPGKSEVLTPGVLLGRLGPRAAAINLLEVDEYLRKSKISRKISGYCEKQSTEERHQKPVRKGAIPPLSIVESFMVPLAAASDDGRVTLTMTGSPGHEEVELKYQLLNPAPQFSEIVEMARSVILAGGTMSPISDVINQLFSNIPKDGITTFSCGHIIPSYNIRVLAMKKGPTGGLLEFKAGKQEDAGAVKELAQTIINLCNIVPSGMIIFFPSYTFLNVIKRVWATDGTVEKLSLKKKIFFEPEESMSVDSVLDEYAEAARLKPGQPGENPTTGAILFAVVGAKLSEGLNFSDELARAVVVVGMPYANLGSVELRERLAYVKKLEEQQLREGTIKREAGKKDAAAELYENMCMNAVNQSIGRAIRHKNDWAALILLDHRYSNQNIRNKLPKWIGDHVFVAGTFGDAFKEIGAFYRTKRS